MKREASAFLSLGGEMALGSGRWQGWQKVKGSQCLVHPMLALRMVENYLWNRYAFIGLPSLSSSFQIACRMSSPQRKPASLSCA